jgi:hypothetical protein
MSFQRVPYGIHPAGTYWQDIDFPIIVRTTGAGRPVLTVVKGAIEAPLWVVNDNLQIEGQEIVHAYKEGSTIQWHIHMITASTDITDRFVKWSIEWVWGNANSPLSDTITTVSDDLLIPANTPDRSMIVREIEQVEMPTMEIGAHIWARLTRVAADGTAPTGNVFASMLQLHVECDSPGSTGIFTK